MAKQQVQYPRFTRFFQWKDGALVRDCRTGKKLDANLIGGQLRAIEQSLGRKARENDILTWANRHRSSPLGRCFEWQHKVAAHRYRLEQARYLLRSIEVIVEISPNVQRPARWVVSLQKERGTDPGYSTMAEIAKSPTRMVMLVQQAMDELQGWLGRYNGVVDLADACAGVQAILKKYGLRKKTVA